MLSLCIVSLICIIAYYQATETIYPEIFEKPEAIHPLKKSNIKNGMDEQLHLSVHYASLPYVYNQFSTLLGTVASDPRHKAAYSNIKDFLSLTVNLTSASEEISIIDQPGIVIFSAEKSDEGKIYMNQSILHKGLSSTFIGSVCPSQISTRPVITVVTPIFDHHGLRIGLPVSEIKVEEAFASAENLARVILISGLLLSSLLTVVFYLLVRRITDPVLAITDTAIQVTNEDFTKPAPVFSQDDVGIHASAFNLMTTWLRLIMKGLDRKVLELSVAKNAVYESQNLYRAIFENIDYALMVIGEDFTIVMINKKMEELVGLNREAIEGKKKWSDFVSDEKDLKRMISCHTQGSIEPDSVPASHEYQICTEGGTIKDVAITMMMIPGTTQSVAALVDISDRKKKEMALIASESKFRSIVEQSLVGIYISDNNRFIYVNPALSQMFGYSSEELYTIRSIYDLVAQENKDGAEAMIQGGIGRQNSFHYSFTGTRKNGSPIEVEMHGSPAEYLGAGATIGVMLDITRRKNAEDALKSAYMELEGIISDRTKDFQMVNKALRKERDFSNNLVYSSPTYLIALNRDGNIILINKSMLAALYYKKEELLGKNYINLVVAPVDREMMTYTLNDLISRKEAVIVEHHVQRSDGKEFLLEWHGTPIISKEGEFDYCFGVSIDISKKKIAEKALQVNESKFRILFQQSELLNRKFLRHILLMPLGYMEINYNYYIIDWNPSAQNIYGYAKQEVMGKKISPLLIRVMPNDFFDPVTVLSAKENRAFRRLETYTKDDREIICDWYITPLQDLYNNLTGWVVIFEDRSEMIRTQEELRKAKEIAEEANVSKGYFLANVSHEIRTPLNAIIGFSSLLSEEVTDPASIRYLQSINSAGKALLQLINDILDLSKIEAHKVELVYTYTDLNRLCIEIDMILGQRAKEKEIEFFLNLPKPSTIMLIDENRVRQILLNLVGNAIKFTQEGFVSLSLEIDSNREEYADLYFRVKDSGIGIPKKDQNRIFSPFEQQHPDHKISFGGTGLGLAICEKLVTAMGGRIDLVSEPHQGSVFTVFIPHVQRLQEGVLSGKKSFHSGIPVQFKPAVVMIIDDIESNRVVLSDMITRIGLTPLMVSSVPDALMVLRSESPDIILMDLLMPGMSGDEFVKEVRSIYRYPDIPVIAITAKVSSIDGSRSGSFDAFLSKPVQIMDLIDTLTKFLAIEPESMIPSGETINFDTFHNLAKKPAFLIKSEILPQMMSVSQIFSVQKAWGIADDIESVANNEGCKELLFIASEFRNAADNYDLRRIKEIIRFLEKISQ